MDIIVYAIFVSRDWIESKIVHDRIIFFRPMLVFLANVFFFF